MAEWNWVPLEQLSAPEKSSISKPYGSAILASDYRESGVPVVRGVNLADGVFRDEDFVYIDEVLASKMPGAQMRSGDLVVTHRGSVGQVSMVPRRARFDTYVASTSHVKVRLDPSLAVPEFFYYWFQSGAGRQSLLENVSTVGVPGLAQPVSTVKRLRVPAPRLKIQRAIAAILGALDDKITANRKIVSACGDLLDAHYTSACPVESNETLGDVAAIGGGGTPSTKNDAYWSGDVHWATPTDITGLDGPWLLDTARTITNAGLEACASPLYPKRSILMTSRATIGSIALAGVPTAVNQGFIVVNAKDPHLQLWLMTQMRARTAEFLSWSNGATFLEISRGIFKALPYYSSTPVNLERFNDRAEVLVRRQEAAQRETQVLTRTRNELLPLLMNGKITVKQAEAKAEEVL